MIADCINNIINQPDLAPHNLNHLISSWKTCFQDFVSIYSHESHEFQYENLLFEQKLKLIEKIVINLRYLVNNMLNASNITSIDGLVGLYEKNDVKSVIYLFIDSLRICGRKPDCLDVYFMNIDNLSLPMQVIVNELSRGLIIKEESVSIAEIDSSLVSVCLRCYINLCFSNHQVLNQFTTLLEYNVDALIAIFHFPLKFLSIDVKFHCCKLLYLLSAYR